MSLRKRIANSRAVNRFFIRLFAGYVRLVWKTTRWEIRGFDTLSATVKSGEPVIMVLWHQRLLMSPYLFDRDAGPICSLTSTARAGRFAGQIQAEFGFQTLSMSSTTNNVAISRDVVRKIRNGVSIGIAADGPKGPAKVSKTVPIVWARMTQRPVYTVAFSTRRKLILNTWDKALLPLPFTKGAIVCKRWDVDLPKRMPPEEMENARLALSEMLNDVTQEADQLVGQTAAAG